MLRCSRCRELKSAEEFYLVGDRMASRCISCYTKKGSLNIPNLTEEELGARDIPGYPGYAVTPDGHVWSHKRWKWLRPGNNNGYLAVRLMAEGSNDYRMVGVHILVLLAYVGPKPLASPEEGRIEGLHKDDVKSNNHFSNLEWGTHRLNTQQALANGSWAGLVAPNRRFTPDEVRDIRRRAARGEPMAHIAALLNTGGTVVRNIVHRRAYRDVQD